MHYFRVLNFSTHTHLLYNYTHVYCSQLKPNVNEIDIDINALKKCY